MSVRSHPLPSRASAAVLLGLLLLFVARAGCVSTPVTGRAEPFAFLANDEQLDAVDDSRFQFVYEASTAGWDACPVVMVDAATGERRFTAIGERGGCMDPVGGTWGDVKHNLDLRAAPLAERLGAAPSKA